MKPTRKSKEAGREEQTINFARGMHHHTKAWADPRKELKGRNASPTVWQPHDRSFTRPKVVSATRVPQKRPHNIGGVARDKTCSSGISNATHMCCKYQG